MWFLTIMLRLFMKFYKALNKASRHLKYFPVNYFHRTCTLGKYFFKKNHKSKKKKKTKEVNYMSFFVLLLYLINLK